MKLTGKVCNISAWDADGAQIKTSFDSNKPVTEFTAKLFQNLSKAGITISQEDSPITVKGKFIRMDEGSRLLRYFLGYAGQAVLEVEGELVVSRRKVADLFARSRLGGGSLFGGSSEGLLKSCAVKSANSISKQIVAAIKNDDQSIGMPALSTPSIFDGKTHTRRQWIAVCEGRLKKGERAEAILSDVIREGYPQVDAEMMVGEAVRDINKGSWKIVGCSSILFILGALITIASFSAANTPEGGSYIIWWGAILFGFIGIVYGLTTFKKRPAS